VPYYGVDSLASFEFRRRSISVCLIDDKFRGASSPESTENRGTFDQARPAGAVSELVPGRYKPGGASEFALSLFAKLSARDLDVSNL
jgi:hypothetical protein